MKRLLGKQDTLALTAALLALAAAFALLPIGATVHAQTDAPGVTPDQVTEVARQLWCPLCSGVRLDTCELKACEQMREVIAIKLGEGEDAESIKAYFLDQYGPQVLGEPPREGFNWLAWILPIVALIAGGLLVWRRTQRLVQPAAQTAGPGPGEPNGEMDEYERQLEEELARYD